MTRDDSTKASLADAGNEGIPAHIFRRRWLILATLCGSLMAVMLANSSLNLALPSMAVDLELGTLKQTWIVEIYSLVFASLLFTSGAIGDRFGRKAVMQFGLVLFAVCSVYAAFMAPSGTELIVARALMGVGGAMVMPTTLSIINVIFPARARARAIAIWTGIAAGGVMFGSLISGLLLEYFDWRSSFVFTAVIAVAALMCNQLLTPESRDPAQTPVDWLGGILSFAGLLGLVYAIMESPTRGLDDRWVLLGLIAGGVCLVAFVLWQLKTTHPMLDVRLFKRRAFTISALTVTLTSFALLGVIFTTGQMLQLVMGYGALKSAVAMFPMMLPMLFLAPLVPVVAARTGSRWAVTMGLGLLAASFLVMARWPTIPSCWHVMVGMMIMAAGMAIAMTPATNMLMSAVPKSRSGMGSAMNDTTRELGGALGIAVLGAMLSSGYADHIYSALTTLPEQARALGGNSLAGALTVAQQLGASGDGFSDAAKTAWMGALTRSMIVAAVICLAATLIVAIWMPHREERAGRPPRPSRDRSGNASEDASTVECGRSGTSSASTDGE